MFKISSKLPPPIIREIFNQKINGYDLRQFSDFVIPSV